MINIPVQTYYSMALDGENLNQAIAELCNLLSDGYREFKNITDSVKDSRQSDAFYFFKKDQHQALLNKSDHNAQIWYDKVKAVAEKYFPNTHYQFRILKPPKTNLVPIDTPKTLRIFIRSFESYLEAVEQVIIWLEEKRSLTIRQEIADKEYEASILYKITFSSHTREIKVNCPVLNPGD